MIFRYIKLKNFCPYYGEQTIRFAADEYCNVTVIRGVNGTGKTSLLNALNWCLYGDSFFSETREFVNRHVVARAENVDTSVEIGFTDQDIEYRVERKCEWFRNNKMSLLLEKENHPPDRDAAASEKICSMIPEDVSAHFFFDGEKIDNFAKPGNEKEIESAVHNVLRIKLLDRGISHLEQVAREYQKELKKHVPDDLQALISEKQEIEALRDKLSEKIEDRLEKVKIARKQKLDIDEKLSKFAETRKLFEEQQKINENIKRVSGEKDEHQEKIRQLANDGFIPLAKPVIEKALEILEENETPCGISESLLKELLDQMCCLCGRPIHDGGPEHLHILYLLAQSDSLELANAVKETYSHLVYLKRDQVEKIPVIMKEALRKELQLEKDIEANEARLDQIRKELEEFNDDIFQEHKNAQKKYEADIRDLEAEINQGKGRIEEIKESIKSSDKKIDKARSSEAKAEHLKRCWQLARESAAAMKEKYAPFKDDMREELQTEVNDIFKRLVWKEKSFREVRLNSNYELQVIDRYDAQVSPEISAGEREVLSLAFIAALAKVAVKKKSLDMPAERFPIVMDAPFTKLSDKPKENITEAIPDIANQLILFVTDQELRHNEQAWKNLEPRIGAEYELHFDDAVSITTVKRIE